jgi:outer membrane protein
MYDINRKTNTILAVTVVLAIAVIGLFFKTKSLNTEFAYVDMQRVILLSKDLNALKNERDTQVQDLKKMADAANEKIKAETNEEAKKKLSEQYLAEINTKKDEYDRLYAAALQASDQKLNNIISSVAEKEGLSVVFNKAAVIKGGVDITDSVIDLVK